MAGIIVVIKLLDEKPIAAGMMNELAEVCEAGKINVESIEWVSTSTDFYSSIQPNGDNLVFIRLNGNNNGLKVATRLREMDENINLIFLSTSSHYALKAFEFYPIDFLIEPIDMQRLKATLIKAVQRKQKKVAVPY